MKLLYSITGNTRVVYKRLHVVNRNALLDLVFAIR